MSAVQVKSYPIQDCPHLPPIRIRDLFEKETNEAYPDSILLHYVELDILIYNDPSPCKILPGGNQAKAYPLDMKHKKFIIRQSNEILSVPVTISLKDLYSLIRNHFLKVYNKTNFLDLAQLYYPDCNLDFYITPSTKRRDILYRDWSWSVSFNNFDLHLQMTRLSPNGQMPNKMD